MGIVAGGLGAPRCVRRGSIVRVAPGEELRKKGLAPRVARRERRWFPIGPPIGSPVVRPRAEPPWDEPSGWELPVALS